MGNVYRAHRLPAGPTGRAQGAGRPPGRGRGLRRASPARVEAGGQPRPPERHPDLRGGRGPTAGSSSRCASSPAATCGPAPARGADRPAPERCRSSPRSPTPSTPRTAAASSTATSSRRNVLLDRDRGPGALLPGRLRPDPERGSDGGDRRRPVLGTVDYVSPEQIRRRQARRPRRPVQPRLPDVRVPDRPLPHGQRSEVAALFAHLEEPIPKASERAAGCRARSIPSSNAAWRRIPGTGSRPAASWSGGSAGAGPGPRELPARAAPLAAGRRGRRRCHRRGAGDRALRRRRCRRGVGDRGLGQDRPLDESGRGDRTAVDGFPGQLVLTPGGVWSADFRTGVLWRCPRARPRPNASPPTASPVIWRRWATASTSAPTGASSPASSRHSTRSQAFAGDSIDLLACAMASGEGVVWAAGCPFVQRLSTDERPLRTLRQRFLPFRSPATVENSRVQFRELAVGAGSLWVLGDALDRRLWRLDARTGRVEATIRLGFPRPRSRWPTGRPGSPTTCTTGSSRSTRPTMPC